MAQQPLARSLLRQPWRPSQASQFFSKPAQQRSLSTTISRLSSPNGSGRETPESETSTTRQQPYPSYDSGPTDAASLLKKYHFPGTTERQEDKIASARKPLYAVDSRIAKYVDNAQSSLSSAYGATTVDTNHHLHVYSHRHNCHITLTGPDRSPLLSLSAGKLGFRNSHRGTYDAAYQLAVYTLTKMVEKGIIHHIQGVELVLRGYGPGREAVVKAIVGTEGRRLKPLIVRVTDATRLKFGGTKSKNVRRL